MRASGKGPSVGTARWLREHEVCTVPHVERTHARTPGAAGGAGVYL